MKKLVFVFAFLLLFPVSVPAASQQGQPDAPAAKAQEWPPRDSTAVPRHDTLDGTTWMALSPKDKRFYAIAYGRGRLNGEQEAYRRACTLSPENTGACKKMQQLYPYLVNPPEKNVTTDFIAYLDRAYADPRNTHIPLAALIATAYHVCMMQQDSNAFDSLVEKLRKGK